MDERGAYEILFLTDDLWTNDDSLVDSWREKVTVFTGLSTGYS